MEVKIMNPLVNMKLLFLNKYLEGLSYLDAVNQTANLMNKIKSAAQIVGFAGGIAIAAVCFAIMGWGSDRWRDKIKAHLIWVFASVIGLFAVAALATMAKQYSQSAFGG